MAYRSPARWMAPLALLAALVAVGVIVGSTTGGSDTPSPTATEAERSETQEERADGEGEGTETTPATPSEPRRYRVQSGDTLGAIAEKTGVSVEDLEELNPGLDPQSLTVGQRIRLRR